MGERERTAGFVGEIGQKQKGALSKKESVAILFVCAFPRQFITGFSPKNGGCSDKKWRAKLDEVGVSSTPIGVANTHKKKMPQILVGVANTQKELPHFSFFESAPFCFDQFPLQNLLFSLSLPSATSTHAADDGPAAQCRHGERRISWYRVCVVAALLPVRFRMRMANGAELRCSDRSRLTDWRGDGPTGSIKGNKCLSPSKTSDIPFGKCGT